MNYHEPEENLTPRQQQLLDFIRNCIEDNSRPPSYREIMQHMQVRSPKAVCDMLAILVRKGYIAHSRQARSISLVTWEEEEDEDNEYDRLADRIKELETENAKLKEQLRRRT